MTVKVIIVDDHNTVRQGIQSFLELDPQIEVVGTAEDGAEGVRKVHELKPDVVLMDVLMPVMDGIEATKRIKEEMPGVQVFVLTSVLEKKVISQAVEAKADGYILKSIDAEDLRQVVKSKYSGSIVLSPEAVNILDQTNESHSPQNLTEREMDVLRMIAKGKANKEIAHSFNLSEGTIKTHVSVILAKLNLQSRTQAALYASEQGWV